VGGCATKRNDALDPIGLYTYSYQIVPAHAESNKNVTYTSPFTYRKPFTNKGGFTDQDYYDTATSCWGFHINNLTGELNMRPTQPDEFFPVAVNLLKFSNGKLVSRVTRDLLYTTIYAPENRPPVLTGVDCTKPTEISIVAQLSKCFTICSFDPDIDDSVTLTGVMEMSTASFIPEQSKKWPKAQFCWTPTLMDIREAPYTLDVYADDNHVCDEAMGLEGSGSFHKTILIYVTDSLGHSGFGEIKNHFNLKIYPQPATSKVYAHVPEYALRKVALIDMTGRSISPAYSFMNGKLQLDISALPAGSYLLQAVTDKNIYSGKVIVTK
jgi:hypothetical protein